MEENRSGQGGCGRKNRAGRMGGAGLLLVSVLMILLGTIGGTMAFVTAKTEPIRNRFRVATVSCEVEEAFDGKTKTGIVVKNTGTARVYTRVKLVSYRVDEKGERIGGLAEIPEFSLGTGWRREGKDTYYYRYPLGWSGEGEDARIETQDLIAPDSRIDLRRYPEEDGGGRQVIEVLAEVIQSRPKRAVADAWPEEIVDWLSEDEWQETGLPAGRKREGKE